MRMLLSLHDSMHACILEHKCKQLELIEFVCTYRVNIEPSANINVVVFNFALMCVPIKLKQKYVYKKNGINILHHLLKFGCHDKYSKTSYSFF